MAPKNTNYETWTQTDLTEAVAEGDLEGVEAVFDRLRPVNGPEQPFKSLIHSASKHGHFNIVSYFLQKSFDPNATNAEGFTPMQIAAQNGHIKVAITLMAYKVKVNIGNDKGTPLGLAALAGKAEMVEFLIENGADVYLVDALGNRPIHYAAAGGNLEVMKLVLFKMFNPLNKSKETPIKVANSAPNNNVKAFLTTLNLLVTAPSEKLMAQIESIGEMEIKDALLMSGGPRKPSQNSVINISDDLEKLEIKDRTVSKP